MYGVIFITKPVVVFVQNVLSPRQIHASTMFLTHAPSDLYTMIAILKWSSYLTAKLNKDSSARDLMTNNDSFKVTQPSRFLIWVGGPEALRVEPILDRLLVPTLCLVWNSLHSPSPIMLYDTIVDHPDQRQPWDVYEYWQLHCTPHKQSIIAV